jgi:flagellar hook assembly protein FlgD
MSYRAVRLCALLLALAAAPVLPVLEARSADPHPAPNPSRLSHQLSVSVRVDSVSNLRSGDFLHCVDPLGVGCGRADWFAVMSFTDGNGVVTKCNNTPWIQNFDFIQPGWSCQAGGTERTGPWDAPVTFSIDIYDFDGTGLANIDGADHADITAGAGNTFTTTVSVGTTSLVTASSDVRVGVTLTASMVPAQFVSFNVSPTTFDPRLGEITTLSWNISEGSPLTMTVQPLAGGATVRTQSIPFTIPPQTQFEWDGKDDGGAPLAAGNYRVRLTATAAASGQVDPQPGFREANVTVTMRPPNVLTLQQVTPAANIPWNPRSGPVELRFSVSSDADVGLQAFAGNACSGSPVAVVTPTRLPLGTSTLRWNGKNSQGQFVSPGAHAVQLGGHSPTGTPTTPATVCRALQVIAAPALELVATHDPIVANAGGLVSFTVEAVEASHRARRTAKLEIWVADAASFRSRVPPTSPAESCESRATCIFTVINPSRDAGLPSRFAYKAVAYDLEDGPRAETPWRAVDVVDYATTYGLSTPTIPRAAGVVSDPFGVIDSHHTQDLVFYPGSGHDVTTGNGRAWFSGTVRAHIRQIWGLGPGVFPSSALSRQEAISFYVVQRLVPVTESDPDQPTAENLCSIGAIEKPPFAEVNAVLHQLPCRDNAPWNMYTADNPATTWHELHHAMFGLADEYFVSGGGTAPDLSGGYWQPSPNPNLYFWPNDCANDPLAGGRTCTAIRPAGSPIPGQSTRWWRFDLTPDVMIDNTFEQPGETRRAIWVLDQCKAALC